MEAKDLMIGDWVTFTSKYDYGTGQVVGIEPREGSAAPTTFTIWKKDKEGNTKFFVGVSKNCVGPIPLTAEILEKNFDKRPECYGIFDDYFDFMVREYSDGIFIANYHHCEMPLPDTQIADIAFVHELQHVLRLCGIEKEIQL